MSNTLAIATVTETLLRVLTQAVASSGVNGAKVTATRPDDRTNLPLTGGVNIFLYQVSPNPHLRNADLPTRRRDGTPIHRPQAALDLYYLITFYGEDASLDQQRLLGCVVRQLHAHPALHHPDIVSAQSVAFLNGSNLADQTELIRFTPINFSLEELSKLWSVFLKTDYALSVAYVASVVLIETDDLTPATALPVLRPCLVAEPFSLTVIDSVQPQTVDFQSPPGLSLILLLGQNLNPADTVTFRSPGLANPIPATVVNGQNSPNQLVVELPDGLRPGINTVTLTHFTAPGSPPDSEARIISESNAAAFVLRPSVSFPTPSPGGQITALISPAVDPIQRVTLLLNAISLSPPVAPLAYQLAGLAVTNPPGGYTFAKSFTPVGALQPITVPAGTYLARVRVDAAESLLTLDASGAYNGPLITIP